MTKNPISFLFKTNNQLAILFIVIGFACLFLLSILTSMLVIGFLFAFSVASFLIGLYFVTKEYEREWKLESNGM